MSDAERIAELEREVAWLRSRIRQFKRVTPPDVLRKLRGQRNRKRVNEVLLTDAERAERRRENMKRWRLRETARKDAAERNVDVLTIYAAWGVLTDKEKRMLKPLVLPIQESR